MDEATRQRYETRYKDLRVKIKTWELEYFNSHDRKKPGREDIKNSGMSRSHLLCSPCLLTHDLH